MYINVYVWIFKIRLVLKCGFIYFKYIYMYILDEILVKDIEFIELYI